LFFIPTTWVGPVIAPLINCAIMILFALCIFHFESRSRLTKLGFGEWSLLIGGSLIIIFSYTAEYSIFMLTQFSLGQLLDFTNNYEVMKYATKYIPEYFNWFVFGAGCILHLLAVFIYCIKYINPKK